MRGVEVEELEQPRGLYVELERAHTADGRERANALERMDERLAIGVGSRRDLHPHRQCRALTQARGIAERDELAAREQPEPIDARLEERDLVAREQHHTARRTVLVEHRPEQRERVLIEASVGSSSTSSSQGATSATASPRRCLMPRE